MIRVTIELIPNGYGPPRTLGVMHVANTGTGTNTRGDYEAKVYRKGVDPIARVNGVPHYSDFDVTRTGVVKDYPRLSYSVWRLILRCLKSAFPEEKA